LKKRSSATDPLWYKDAIIYEIHVRAFMDSNGDGIGDFPGLMSKLDYLQDLGVTCLWVLPFFPSPLRDDGYDIANYVDVNPSYGTLNDFKQFLDAAHVRGMQVMIELVINHTSDQHPWFQAARLAAPGSPERDFYVWSQSDQLFKDARIIFTDTEKSNWTWDEAAKSYYWHRFFSHQPDLNFDNPAVIEEVLKAMRFWLDMGVDALRMDAIPYLVERDGTTCENLPETHVVIKKIRAAIDAEYENRLVLAEANQWPADVRPYFGDGDECHMAFHFPLMPRIYMALRQEDRLPITDIMAQTPAIPDNCQWGLFLRNHDELTLEMVTDNERDYMYLAYSADPRMRINVGIRRRLAPLVDNNRRRIELLNSLLLSFPGTPILYYGDEIGMGDNIYLGDRNGVRTPMQWNSDRNAGFSTAVPARLYFPVITDPIWGYQSINVEAQQSDQSSLLHWTRNMIALRKLFQVFGRGTQEFLNPENRKILAYIRRYDDPSTGGSEVVLCVANLSRFSQPVSLDLKQFAGMVPVEMLGYVTFPTITPQPYPLTLAPYSFIWLELQAAPTVLEPEPLPEEDTQLNVVHDGIADVLEDPDLPMLLQTYLPRQRWFGAKSRTIKSVEILSTVPLPDLDAALAFLRLTYENDETSTYQLPLALSKGASADEIRSGTPGSIIASISTSTGPAVLHDAVSHEDVRQALLNLIGDEKKISTASGVLEGHRSSSFAKARGTDALAARVGSAEQSNTSILFGSKLILKLFRRLESGENPDTEIGRFLTETAHFPRIAPFLGDITLKPEDGPAITVGMLQGLVENEGDGWEWTLNELSRYYESVAVLPAPQSVGATATFAGSTQIPSDAKEYAGLSLDAAALLGRRTAEMHLALATATKDVAFSAESFTPETLKTDAARIEEQLARSLEALKRGMSQLSESASDKAALVLSRRLDLVERTRNIAALNPEDAGQRTRIHGDYHLGQLLRSHADYVILDFEGEPARSLAARRAKQSPLKDVAGMLRSFSYAAYAGLNAFSLRRPEDAKNLEPWAKLWQNAVSSEFINAYWNTITSSNPSLIPEEKNAQNLLDAYLLEKALYELLYELDNRPGWVSIPLSGVLSLIK
jgi:maltose alpha-D-glucosyltransferase/alpha-amylase